MLISWFDEFYIFSEMNPYADCIYWYGHYIDDVIIIWPSDVATAPVFVDNWNPNAFHLYFTHQFDDTWIPFSDIYLDADQCKGIVHTSTYRKPMASNSILHANPAIRFIQ